MKSQFIRLWLPLAALLGAVMIFAACGGSDGPEANSTDVLAHLDSENYQSWQTWPGVAKQYPGDDPHGMLLTTYLNPSAYEVISGSQPWELPDGAILVKENYMPDGALAATTVMYKKEGYNAAHNDWYWLKTLADGNNTVEVEGMVEGCQTCHSDARSNDYVWGPQQ